MEKNIINEPNNKPSDGFSSDGFSNDGFSNDRFASDSKSALSSGKNYAESGMGHAKESTISSFNDAKDQWLGLERAIVAKGQEAGKAGRIYIYQNPFKSVLVASAAGLAIGYLLSILRK